MRKYIKENDFCGHLCQYAEQNIHILQLEIARLKAEKESLINGQETLQKYIMELEKKGNPTMKEVTTVTTIQITTIHKGVDESDLLSKDQVEKDVKGIIDDLFVCDDINVKHQIFVLDDVEGADDTNDN